MDRRRRGSPRLVLRCNRSVPVSRVRLHVRCELHDGGAPDPRLGGVRRPEPAAPRAAREGRGAKPARRRLPAGVWAERVVLRVGGVRPARARDQAAVTIRQNWGAAGEFSVGVEEELMILEPETLRQVGKADVIVEASRPKRGEVKYELFASVVELATDICVDADDAAAVVGELRRGAAAVAAANVLTLAAAGTHPTSISAEQAIAPDPRYHKFV